MERASMVARSDAGSEPNGAGLVELRAHLHGMWAGVAGAWGDHADYADARGRAAAEQMLDLTMPRPGERVLELACGPAGLGLAAAVRVAPDGEVVLSDVVPEMTSIAAARAAALGIGNVSTRVLDLEQIDEPDGSYDVVLCREGLMFAADPGQAAREIRRVLRPGGRLSVAVWGPRDRNPWLGLVLAAASAQLRRPVPPPGIPGPFSLDDAQLLAGVLTGAGLVDVSVEELSVPLEAASFEEWWTRTTALAGPLASILAKLPEAAALALRESLREQTRPFEMSSGLTFPGLTLIAGGRV